MDDDPTGSQTVHTTLLLTRWDTETLVEAFNDDSPLFFVLTNTRGMNPTKATEVTREVCKNLKEALSILKAGNKDINPVLVSRSDSTLRGHYPVETNVIAEEVGPFDAHFLVPAFFEGGRITRNSTHYLAVEDKLIPCHETEFAKDSVFGYSTAYLPDYVEEKTNKAIKSSEVQQFTLEEVQGDSEKRLVSLSHNACCVVNCEKQSDLDNFCGQLKTVAERDGRRFLFRSGASLLTALAQLPPQPIPAEEMDRYVPHHSPGAIIIGSHVKKSTEQLDELLKISNVVGIEVDVQKIRDGEEQAVIDDVNARAAKAHAQHNHIAVFTSRNELAFPTQEARLEFGEKVSSILMEIVQNLPTSVGFLISKGGITTNDVLSTGLSLRSSRVLGQILPGCSVVRCPSTHRFADMPVVIFPGNVGDKMGMVTVLERLSTRSNKGNI